MSNVIVCASEEVKAIIQASVETSDIKDELKTAIFNELEALPDCEGELPVDFADARAAKTPKGRKKRKPSGYNLFVSDCMIGKKVKSFGEAPKAMKECGLEWRKGGEALKKKYDEKAKAIGSAKKD